MGRLTRRRFIAASSAMAGTFSLAKRFGLAQGAPVEPATRSFGTRCRRHSGLMRCLSATGDWGRWSLAGARLTRLMRKIQRPIVG